MAQTEKELNADGHLAKLLETPSVEGYVVFNSDGIPMRYDNVLIDHKKAVHIASLFWDYFRVCRKIMGEDLKTFTGQGNFQSSHKGQLNHDHEIELIRMRTSNCREYIMTYHHEFFIVCIQKFVEEEIEEEVTDSNSQMDSDEFRFERGF